MIQIKEATSDREIREITEGEHDKVYISHSTEESISVLSTKNIDKAVVSIKSLTDVGILKYINEYYPKIEVVVMTNKALDDVISIFQKSNYSVIHEPLRISELKNQFTRDNQKKASQSTNSINN